MREEAANSLFRMIRAYYFPRTEVYSFADMPYNGDSRKEGIL